MEKSTKQEIKFISLLMGTITIFFMMLYFDGIRNIIEGWNPYSQFILLNLSILIMINFVFKIFVLKNKRPWHKQIISSLGMVFVFLGIDLILPDFHLTLAGEFLTGPAFSMSSIDYVVAHFWNSLGINGIILWFMTYPITFLIFMGIGAVLEKNIVEKI
jgi:hypothetical protein